MAKTVSVYLLSGETGLSGPSEAFQEAADFVHEVRLRLRSKHGLPYHRTFLLQVGKGIQSILANGTSWEALGEPCEVQVVVRQPSSVEAVLRKSAQPHVVEDLLTHGLDPNLTDEDGKTLSHHVLERCQSISTCAMLGNSMEQIWKMVDATDRRKVTMLRQLWLACADFTIRDKEGKSAIDLAAGSGPEVRAFCRTYCT